MFLATDIFNPPIFKKMLQNDVLDMKRNRQMLEELRLTLSIWGVIYLVSCLEPSGFLLKVWLIENIKNALKLQAKHGASLSSV